MRNTNFLEGKSVAWRTRRTQPSPPALWHPRAASQTLLALASILFLLAADIQGANHWEYNRKIADPATDQPTGGGTAIAAFDDLNGPFVDGALHRMKAIVNGKTVKLYLDDVFGAEVKFPFANLVFHIGSYAR